MEESANEKAERMEKQGVLPDEKEPSENEKQAHAQNKDRTCGSDPLSKMSEAATREEK